MYMSYRRALALTLLLYIESDWRDPNPERSRVTAMEHSLQTATRARRYDEEDDELIVAALMHDAARPLSDVYHGEVIAEVLRDLVRPDIVTALQRHGEYQSAILHATPMPEGPLEAQLIAAWDAASFNPEFKPDPLNSFMPHVNRVCA